MARNLMAPPDQGRISAALTAALRQLVGADNVVDQGETLATLSLDFYWYSPVLKRELADKRADAVVRPRTMDELRGVIAACCRARVPVVPRGAGTGNYGQCVPIFGGVVVDLTLLDRIIEISADGVLRAEPGARLGRVETEARRVGWEMRCLPSTWMKSTLAGFLCGGFGGIGTITWGSIWAPGTVRSLTLLTCEENPREIRLEGAGCELLLHTYGTTGIVTEVRLGLAPRVDYDQLILNAPDWDRLLDWTDAFARSQVWRKRLVTAFERPIPSYFKPLRKRLRPDEHATFLLTDRAQTPDVIASAQAAGLACVYQAPLSDPPMPPFITDYTWNHTTLWAINHDPAITYLQADFGEDFRAQFAQLKQRFPDEVLLHLEWMAAHAGPAEGAPGKFVGQDVRVGGIPLVHFTTEARLREILEACAEIGIYIANPHTFVLEDGGRIPNLDGKRTFRSDIDPAGLLNPGKMKTAALNPFAPA